MLTRKIWDVQHHDPLTGKLTYRAQYTIWLLLFLPVFIRQTYLYNPMDLPETFLSNFGEGR